MHERVEVSLSFYGGNWGTKAVIRMCSKAGTAWRMRSEEKLRLVGRQNILEEEKSSVMHQSFADSERRLHQIERLIEKGLLYP